MNTLLFSLLLGDMDDMSRALNEDLLRDLECPVCMDYMVPPIKMCTNGHNICSKCTERVYSCPTCSARFSDVRSVVLENIARRLKYPCANKKSGCLDLFSIEHMAKHQAGCVFGKIKCPFQITGTCSWRGLKNDLKKHAEETHSGVFFDTRQFSSKFLGRAVVFVSFFGELFSYYKNKRDGRYYAAVQLIGTSSEASKYKCEFKLRAPNGIEQISNTFLVQGYSEDWETIFNSGKCLKLDEDTVTHFVEGNELKLTVTLSRV